MATIAVGLGCLAFCFWLITAGTGQVLYQGGFDRFYDSQSTSLLSGQWDVSPVAIMGEAFVVRGKYYGYFGFAPALPRILLNALFPRHFGQWTRFLMLFCVASIIVVVFAFMEEFEVRSSPLLVAIAVLGSTLVFLCSYAFTYHEAILTGSAFALWAYLFFLLYCKRPHLLLLAAACLFSFLSFFSRFTVGAGPLMVALFVSVALAARHFTRGRNNAWANGIRNFADSWKWPSSPATGRHGVFLIGFLAATAGTYVSVNHAKFGTWLNPAPYQYNVQYDAARLARIDGSIAHLSNIPFGVGAYFGPSRVEFRKSFPWFQLTARRPDPSSLAKIDHIERYASITAAMPGLLLLAVIGLVAEVRRRDAFPIVVAALAAGCLILPIAYITYRYAHDFYPFLLISAVLGIGAVQSISRKWLRRAMKMLVVATGIWSIGANIAFALTWQRENIWSDPELRHSFLRFRARVDALLPWDPEPLQYRIGDPAEFARTGQLLLVQDSNATYRYDGSRWILLSGRPLHCYDLLATFRPADPGLHEPLWFAGSSGPFGVNDAVYVVYGEGTSVKFCSDHSDSVGTCGAPVRIQPGREYRLRIDADRLNARLTVALDGIDVLRTAVPFHSWRDADVLVGRSLVPAVHGRTFSGVVTLEKR